MLIDTSYYHRRKYQTLQFLIPPNKSILYYGERLYDQFRKLQPCECVVIQQNKNLDPLAHDQYKDCQVIHLPYMEYKPKQTFDYIILDGAIGETNDICQLLTHIRLGCAKSTRVIVYQHNYLWQGLINLGTFLKLKKKDRVQNWLSLRDLKSCLSGMSFQLVRKFRKTIFPIKFIFVGPLLNWLTDWIPLLDLLKLDQFIIARPVFKIPTGAEGHKSLSIVITVRNEEKNIELIVKSFRKFSSQQEVIFVEGHSTDGTRAAVERMIQHYPEKNIKLLSQPGIGQGDAIRTGFKEAAGDIVILFEGDGTSQFEDVQYFYDTMKEDNFEFIEGSRFIYPLDTITMPLINKIGNIFFARWFSIFLGQHVTDVLSGIKAISKREFDLIDQSWGFVGDEDPFGDFELLYGAIRYGLKFCEIPMQYKPRQYGKSKTKVFGHGSYLFKMAIKGFFLFRSTSISNKNIS